MKKLALFLSLVLLLTACGSKPAETTETSLSDAEMFAYVTGLENNEGVADVAVSLPMMGAQAYHVVMVRGESAEKATELAQYLFDNADIARRRLSCVSMTERVYRIFALQIFDISGFS